MTKQYIDRLGMIQDARAAYQRVWRGTSSLSNEPCNFAFECESFQAALAFEEYCPNLRGLGLRGEVTSSSYRCGNCWYMQNAGGLMIWIEDGTMMGDPLWAIKENCSGGGGSGWCVPCVQKLIKKAK